MDDHKLYQAELASFLGINTSQVFLYWKGRVALYAVLKSMGIRPGDEVVLPAFTCVVVPNAILYLGATPVYVDINPKTLCCHVSQIEKVLTPKTKVILIQNMLGLSDHVIEIIELAKERGLYTLEDCTHGFGGKHHGVFNGLRSDASFFSSQWNKPFSTGIGGMLVVNNKSLLNEIKKVNESLIKPSIKDRFILGSLIWARSFLLKGTTYWTLLRIYRWLSKKGWVIGSSTKEEIESIVQPVAYFKGMSNVQCRVGIKALKKLPGVLQIRKNNAHELHNCLLKKGKTTVPNDVLNQHAFLKYPLLVKDRSNFLQLAEKSKLPFGDWFNSPLHPVKGSLLPWGLNVEDFPEAKKISEHLVNIPLETSMPRLINFLELYTNEII